MSRTIDMTPTWAAVLPAFIAVLESGTEAGRQAAREELARMAQAADQWNAHAKAVEAAAQAKAQAAAAERAWMTELHRLNNAILEKQAAYKKANVARRLQLQRDIEALSADLELHRRSRHR